MTRSRVAALVAAAIPLAYLGYFFAYPLVSILATGLSSSGRLDLSPVGDVVGSAGLRGVAWFTLWQATVSTVLTLVVGLPGAFVLARRRFPGRAFVRAAITVPFVLPTVVVGAAFIAIIGPGGMLGVDLRRTVWAILLAHVFYNYAVVVRTVGTVWERIDPRLEEAARSLGAGPWQMFREVTLPLLRPAILAAGSLVFLFTFTSFGVILILGDFTQATLEVEIYQRAIALLDLPVAAALSLLQLIMVGAIILFQSHWQQRRTVALPVRAREETARRPATAGEWAWVGGNLAVMATLLGLPLWALVWRSLTAGGEVSLAAYRGLGERSIGVLAVPAAEAIGNSLQIALPATAIALIVGTLAAGVVAYRRGWPARTFDALLVLPLGTSAVTVGLGLLIAMDAPIDLRGSWWLIPAAHAVVAAPFVVRTMVPVMRTVQGKLREAAAVLGASPTRAWREVDLPIIARAGFVGAGFAFAVSLGEFGATLFITRYDTPTLPVAIFRLLGQPGALTLGRAMALSVILMVLTALSVVLVDRFRAGSLGEF